MIITTSKTAFLKDPQIKAFEGHYYKKEQIDISSEEELSIWRWITTTYEVIESKEEAIKFRVHKVTSIKAAKNLITKFNKGGQNE